MYQIDFSKPIHVHFIGIGGISMSGLASILLKQQFHISGSDAKESALTVGLEKEGAVIYYGQRASNIKDGTDLVVYTAAVHPDNPEYAEAAVRGIPMMSRAELLGQLMRNYRTPIAVSGTHGKTTVTSMASHILLEADMDPTISVGGILKAICGNIRVGGHETFITEACEYTNSFLHFYPRISLILNIDADHLDFFKDLEDIRNSFRLFAQRLPEDGILIISSEIEKLHEITDGLPCRVITYGENGEYTAENISYDGQGHGSFHLVKQGALLGRICLKVPGKHNISMRWRQRRWRMCWAFRRKQYREGFRDFPVRTDALRKREKSAELRLSTIMPIIRQRYARLLKRRRTARTKLSGVYFSLIPIRARKR